MRRYRLVRTCGLALLGWTLLGSALTRPAWATVYTVTSTGNNTSDPTTLAGAITAANSNPGSTINFNLSPGSTITLSSALPLIEANMTINGAGASGLTISGNHANQVFFVDNGTVTIKNLAIANGAAVGGNGASGAGGGGGALGAGGALFVNSTANVTVQNVSFNGNTATGGAGGNGGAANGGGGGGGLGASGGSGSNGGGGGGGLAGTGGHGSNGGGGGGGISGSGGQGSNGGAGGGGTTAGSNASNAGGSGSSGASGGISGSSSSTNAPAGNGGNGQSPASGGGGGGGLGGSNSGNGFAGNGGAGGNGGTGGGGGGGGLGGSAQSTPILSGAGGSGGNGGLDGGGGGAGSGINGTNQGGAGGDFGGGGGGSTGSFGGGTGGAGGFGGGGGGAGNTGNATGGAAGFGAGAGGNRSTAGNGGSGYGGAVFVRQGGTLTVQDTGVTGSSVTGGTGASSGSTDGSGMYLMTGVNAGLAVTSGSQTVSDGIGGAGGLTKTGAGTLVLSGANDYTGGTTVSAGTLTGTTTSLQGGITNNAAVVFGQSTNGTYAGSMIGSGTLTKTGIGNLTLSGANSYSGGTTVSAGTLTGTTTSLQGSITDNSAVAFNQSSNGTYAGNMIGSGSLTLGGIGNVTLSGTNSYSGGTTVSAGTLTGTTTSLQGGITNNAAVVFGQSTNGTYAGSMIGSGTLTKTGIGNLTLSGANSYSGGTTVSAGTLTGTTTSLQGSITDNSAVAFNQSTNGTYAGNMSGSGSLTKTGTGSLSLTGTDTYTGPTTVSGGRLAVNGSITSNTTIFTGATLGGNGSITGNVSNSGVVGPGNSIGTLTIHGNYTQNADGNFQEQINNAGNTPGVNNDLLVVHGIAQLGGNVEVQPASGTILLNTRYTFLEATSISGTFNSISVDNVANTRAVLGFDSTDYWFTLLPNFAPLATNSNQFAVATYIDNNFSGLQSLITTLDTLSPSQIQNAFDQLSGSIYGSESQTQLQSSTLELSFLTRQIAGGLIDSGANPANEAAVAASDPSGSRFDPNTVVRGQNAFWPMRRPQGNWNTWALGYGLGGNAQASASGAAGFNYSLGGSVVGGDLVDDNRMLGVYAGYVGSRVGSYLAGQSVQGNGGQLGLYLRKDDGFNYYILLGGLGGDGYYSHRQMQFGNINSTAIGNYGGWQSQAYLERGVTMQGARASLQPYAALQYLYVRQNSFTETGAGQLNLNVAGIDANSLRSLIGMRLAGTGWNRNGRIVTPVARALWLHELLSPSTSLNAQFAPIGGSNFAVQGANLGRDWAILGTGLNCNLGCGWQAYANYDAQVNTQQVFHVGSGGVQYTW